jgi:hypothetical protein
MIRTWSETGSLRHRLGYAWRPKLPGIWAAYALLLLLSTQAGACSLFGEGRRTAPAVVLEEGPDREGPVEASPETSTSDASTDSMDASNSDGPGPMGNPLDRVLTDPPVLAWMLPFSLDKRSLDALRNPSDQKRNRPMVGLGFWEGALLAADTLEALGISVDLMAFDTKNSVAEVRSLCRKPELQQADLLLGPMFKGPMQEAMQFAREQGIPIVSPYLRHNSEELGHGQYGLRPDNGHLLEALGSYLAEERRRDRIIVLRRDSAEEVRLTQHLLFGMPDSASRSRVIEWRSDFRLEGLEDTLSLVEHNAIVVPSRDEVFVNAVCRALATLSASGEHRISVYGLSDWRRFESIALDYLNRIDWHFPVHYWPEVDSAFAEGFDAQFRRRFKGPPSPFSYLGYDLTLYWGQRLHREALAEGRDAGSAPAKDPDRPLRWPDLPSSYEGMLDAFSFEAVAKGRAPGEYLGTDTTSPGTTKADREANSSDHVDPYQSPLEHAWLNRHWHLIRYRNWSFAPIKSGH